jgi:hypothetical protein
MTRFVTLMTHFVTLITRTVTLNLFQGPSGSLPLLPPGWRRDGP